MKKLIALLILMSFGLTNTAIAESELYYLKNVSTDTIKPFVENSYIENGYNIFKQNPYYGISQNNDDYAIVILQQSGQNMFYYYNSGKGSKINKAILKNVKNNDIVCEQSFNTNIIDIYDGLAQNIIASSGAVKQYSFEEPEYAFAPPQQTEQKQQTTTYRGYVTQLATGTKINVYLQNAINTATAAKGDVITAVVQSDVKINGMTIIPQGSLVYGNLSKARNATYGSRNGRVVINFNKIITPENKIFDITTEEIDFAVSNEGKVANSAKNALKSAAVGAVVGLICALLADKSVGRATAIGAGVGAGASVVSSAAERGVDAEIPSFTELELTLTNPISVNVGL